MIRTIPLLLAFLLIGPLPAKASTDLTGNIVGSKNCADTSVELFVSKPETKTLLYQVHVAPKGSFYFKLKEGRYELRAAAANGCEAINFFELKPAENKKTLIMTLNLNEKREFKK